MTKTADDFTLIRFDSVTLPDRAQGLIDAVKAGDVPGSLNGAFKISSDVQWSDSTKTYDRVEIVRLASLRNVFVVPNDQADSLVAWLDAAIPEWRTIDNGYGWPSITVRPLADDPEFLGQQMVAWLSAAERQSDIDGRM